MKAMSLVGLDVQARQMHAPVFVLDTGELAVSKLRMGPVEVVSFLEGLGPGVRTVEDIRGDLMRARHRLGKFFLRQGERYPGPGANWTTKHLSWLRALRFEAVVIEELRTEVVELKPEGGGF